MESKPEKIFVAIGDDKQDGFSTLSWVLKKWSNSSSITIVILYSTIPSFKDGFIQTYFGKMPANYVNDATVEALRKTKEEDNDKLLSEYQAFCGKVPTEILKIKKYDEPIHKLLVDLLSGLAATKLVMDISFMKYSSWKSKGAITDSLYIQRNKPDFCEMFIVFGGKLVFLREDNINYSEGISVEDENGIVIASKLKEKGSSSNSIMGLWGKMLSARVAGDQKNVLDSPSSTAGKYSSDEWDNCVHEIESYFGQLMSLNDNDDNEDEDERSKDKECMMEISRPEIMIDSDEIEALRIKVDKARESIQQMRNEIKGNVERQTKAEWAHSLCARRAEVLETRIKEEIISQTELKREFENIQDQSEDISKEIEDKLQKLKSIVELLDELSARLHISSMARSRADLELEKAVARRADTVRQIEELRRQRDVLHRRIEFCKEKDAIRTANQLGELEFQYKEFDAQEIRKATEDFSENLRLKSAGNFTNVYKGRINRTFVAIKLFNIPGEELTHEAFLSKVQLLGQIHHPHIVSMIGFCAELKCIVFEYMHRGSLRDVLFGSRKRNRSLSWNSRVHIASQVCSGLGFIHSARPKPLAHGSLDPSKILLDQSLVAKIHGIGHIWCQNESETKPDIRAFGNLVLQLLTGRNWAGLVEETMLADHGAVLKVLDPTAGQWPMDLALEFAGIGLKCLSMDIGPEMGSPIAIVASEVEKVRRDAANLVGEDKNPKKEDNEESSDVPRVFICPIFQGVMKNPHVAADGFSYELEAIEEWLSKGHDTSPITKLKLKHKSFTPNHTLRSLIQDWNHERHRSSGLIPIHGNNYK
ncbi:putative U-box domain-containing protein 50 [Impatiens glandulifera]|uniref:putative U-box domain-containing protein 50 n=1 Tax=Impatiens glandulifera TaxID=253017 RepID=UPI001FB14D3D|nr:putative U-box domain-containing protein 50 [Impatiens glandulifera]